MAPVEQAHPALPFHTRRPCMAVQQRGRLGCSATLLSPIDGKVGKASTICAFVHRSSSLKLVCNFDNSADSPDCPT